MSIPAHLDVLYVTSLMAHGGIRRLFVMGVVSEVGGHNVVLRIDPVTGRVELHWTVDEGCRVLTLAGDSLLMTYNDCLKLYSVNGDLLRVVDVSTSNNQLHMYRPFLRRSCFHPHSTITTLFQSRSRKFLSTGTLLLPFTFSPLSPFLLFPVSPAIFKMMGSGHIGVMAVIFQGHMMSLVMWLFDSPYPIS